MKSGLLINNQWIPGAGRLPVRNPFTGREIAEAPLADAGQIREAIAAAHAAFGFTRRQPAHQRATLLRAVAGGIGQRRAEFARVLVEEVGKPIGFAEAEVARAILTFEAAAEEARRPRGELLALDAMPAGESHFGLSQRFPLGVIAGVTPFNFPLNLVAHKVAPCIATGNTMVLKPAPKTPLSALLLAEVLVEAGLPAGQVNVVPCSNADAAVLTGDERVKKISFTGSSSVGWALKAQCGRKRITLELGGNAPVIVHEDAEVAAALGPIAMGAFGQAGQSCISVQRVLAHESRYEEVREGLSAVIREKIHTGDPADRRTVVGPLIDAEALSRSAGLIREALEKGARLVAGGGIHGPCLEATVLEDLPADCALATEEAFAPILTLHRYQTFEEAIALANATRYGLQAGVFTRDITRAMRAFEALEFGGVLINQVPTWRVETMPYGGIKDSGFGREGVRYAMEEMTEPKSLILNLH
jgi:glyceraldehyde-3-phosphate dehydrogenase (NADP+)